MHNTREMAFYTLFRQYFVVFTTNGSLTGDKLAKC